MSEPTGDVLVGPWPERGSDDETTTTTNTATTERPVNVGTTTLGPDLAGDTPLTPEWVKTREGWKTRGTIARKQATRGARHWLRRQTTEHGYVPMIGRGIARAARWTAGAEGAAVHAARLDARTQAEEAKRANLKYRTRLIPGKERDRLLAAAKVQKEEAIAAAAVLRKAQSSARRAVTMRALASVAMPAAGVTASGIYGGSVGLGAASMALVTGLGWLGRKTNSGTFWEERHLSIGDGDPMTDSMLNKAYRAAKVLGEDETLKLLTPCLLDRDGKAWEVSFDLPPGTPSKKAQAAVEALAGAFGVAVQQVSQTKGDREGRIHLRVSLEVPFTGKAQRGPLMEAERVNFWREIEMGVSLRGGPVAVCWVERSGLFGGEPGAGKSAAANNVLLAAALDPTVRLYLADGKAGADLTPFEHIAAMYDTDGDPEVLLEILRHIWHVEIPQRRALAREHGSRKLTEEMAQKDARVYLALLFLDEWGSYLASADKDTAKEIDRLLRLIVQQGRALGIITLTATQKPDSDSVPTGIRDILSIKWAMRCLTPQASDTILGQGRAAAGHNAQVILKSQRGVGILMSGESAEPELVRGHYYSDAEVDTLTARAYELRAAAGTLSKAAEVTADVLDHMIKLASASEDGVVTRAELFRHLAQSNTSYEQQADESDRAYGARVGKILAKLLDEAGVNLDPIQLSEREGRPRGWRLDALRAAR
jgi:hypothetical protein